MSAGDPNQEHSDPTHAVGYVEIFQDRDWFGIARRGAFTVYVDRSRFGSLALKSTIRIALPEGVHRLRIRQFYFMSPTVTINVVRDETLRLKADIPRIPLLTCVLKMMRINRALDLSVVEGTREIGTDVVWTKSPSQRGLLMSGLLQLLGFALLVASIAHHSWLLAIPSLILIACGVATALVAVRNHKRGVTKPL